MIRNTSFLFCFAYSHNLRGGKNTDYYWDEKGQKNPLYKRLLYIVGTEIGNVAVQGIQGIIGGGKPPTAPISNSTDFVPSSNINQARHVPLVTYDTDKEVRF
jgi:hypothetical protein